MRRAIFFLLLFALLGAGLSECRADIFTFKDDNGESGELEARLAGSGQGAFILELPDGQYRLISEESVSKREPKDDPEPLSGDEVAAKLEEQFTRERFRSLVKEPYVMGLVLQAPLPKQNEARAKNFLQRVATFMKNVETAFASFVKEARIAVKAPTHPLVVLIFENDIDFEKYAQTTTGGRGLAAQNIAGFYSGLTNRLAIRLAECRTFEVPLHEAIHQQVYNRNVFQRLSPIPHWFNEGIATGFEGNQGKVSIGPTKISARYARQVLAAKQVTFESILSDDKVFSGDVLVTEAYGRAWGLHWLLVTKYRGQYAKYVRTLAGKQPLAKEETDQRMTDFREAFGKELAELNKEFRPFLDASVKRQKVVLNEDKPAGISLTHEALGEVELTAVNRLDAGGRLEVQGKLTNLSPIRPLAFVVMVETDAGTYADWHFPSVDMQKTVQLPLQFVVKPMRGGLGGPARRFVVRIRSTSADSEEAKAWKAGNVPVPTFGGGD